MKLKGNGVFELFLVVLSVVMFFVSWSYNPRARLVPEILSVIMFVLAMMLFLSENVPSMQKRMGFMRQRGFFTKTGSAGKGSEQSQDVEREGKGAETETEIKSENIKLIRLLLWLIAFVVMLRFVSYLITVPLWLLLFIKVEGERSWRQSALVAAGMGIFDYVLFAVLLRATF